MTSFPHRYLHGVIETSCICELMSALPQIPKAHRRLQLFKVHYPVKTTLISFSRRSMLRLESDQAVHTCDVQLFSCWAYLQPYYQQLIWFQLDCAASCPVNQAVLISSNISLKESSHLLEMCDETVSKPMGKCRLLIRNLQNKRRYHFQLIVVDIQEYLVAGEWKPQIWSRYNSRISSI